VERWPSADRRSGRLREQRSGRPHRQWEFRISTDLRINRVPPRAGSAHQATPTKKKKKTLGGGAGFRARRPVAAQGQHSAKIRGSLFSVWIRDTAVERRPRGSTRNAPAADRSRRALRRQVASRRPQRSLLQGRGAGCARAEIGAVSESIRRSVLIRNSFRRWGRPERRFVRPTSTRERIRPIPDSASDGALRPARMSPRTRSLADGSDKCDVRPATNDHPKN
jgi:hypothetical protein